MCAPRPAPGPRPSSRPARPSCPRPRGPTPCRPPPRRRRDRAATPRRPPAPCPGARCRGGWAPPRGRRSGPARSHDPGRGGSARPGCRPRPARRPRTRRSPARRPAGSRCGFAPAGRRARPAGLRVCRLGDRWVRMGSCVASQVVYLPQAAGVGAYFTVIQAAGTGCAMCALPGWRRCRAGSPGR